MCANICMYAKLICARNTIDANTIDTLSMKSMQMALHCRYKVS